MRARIEVTPVALLLSLPACTSVLGLDAPTLAPMHDAATDASDASADSVATEASCAADDASPDAIPPGVKCGGGCFGVVYCTSPSAVCCQHTSDAGVTTYACTASESTCDGYPIVCANDDDCPGSDICCHFNSKMTCDTTAACPSNALVCRPDMSIDCPANKTCDVTAVYAGVTSPYSLCEP
ncbi:MAG TPA: hypothetical protein VF765_05850 [Polyangiaceae bacterium]